MLRDDLIQRPINHLQKGARAPVFQFVGQAGETISSSDLLPQGPVVITFYRGAWCPCCQADLRDIATAMPELRKAGASVLGVFHELGPEANAQVTEEYHLGFPLVNDPQGHAAEAFGIRRTAKEIAWPGVACAEGRPAMDLAHAGKIRHCPQWCDRSMRRGS